MSCFIELPNQNHMEGAQQGNLMNHVPAHVYCVETDYWLVQLCHEIMGKSAQVLQPILDMTTPLLEI